MIIGIGTDIIKISRIKALLIKNQQRFLSKIFTAYEVTLIPASNIDRISGYVAKRFAAKEACSKALGTGIGKHLGFHDLEILQTSIGKPYIKFSIKIKEDYTVHLSMTDEKEYAQALVVIEG